MPNKIPKIDQKLFNYLREVFIQESFQKAVFEIRKKYTPHVVEVIDTKTGEKSSHYIPPHLYKDEYNPYDEHPKLKTAIYNKILIPFALNNAFYELIHKYVIYTTEPSFDYLDWGRKGIEEGVDFGLAKTLEINETEYLSPIESKLENQSYPVVIKLSPYITERDLLEYVSKRFRIDIEPKLNKYRKEEVLLGKQRTKKGTVDSRNNLIYYFHTQHGYTANQIMKVMRKLAKGFFKEGFYDVEKLDTGSISKIISLESKRRKQV